MVGGHPFQVKCLANLSQVIEHLHRYPKIPVIVNAELGHQLGHHAGVYIDPELHHDAVRHATEETLDRGRHLANFQIPWVSFGVSGAFNLYYMFENDTGLSAILTCTVTDTIGRTVGGTTGKYGGAAAGVLLFGPAGAIGVGLLGATGGAIAGRRLSAKGRDLLVRDEEEAVRKAARPVAEAGAESMPEKLEAWSGKSELMAQCLSGPNANQQKMQRALTRRITEHIAHWERKKSELQAAAMNGGEGVHGFCGRVSL